MFLWELGCRFCPSDDKVVAVLVHRILRDGMDFEHDGDSDEALWRCTIQRMLSEMRRGSVDCVGYNACQWRGKPAYEEDAVVWRCSSVTNSHVIYHQAHVRPFCRMTFTTCNQIPSLNVSTPIFATMRTFVAACPAASQFLHWSRSLKISYSTTTSGPAPPQSITINLYAMN